MHGSRATTKQNEVHKTPRAPTRKRSQTHQRGSSLHSMTTTIISQLTNSKYESIYQPQRPPIPPWVTIHTHAIPCKSRLPLAHPEANTRKKDKFPQCIASRRSRFLHSVPMFLLADARFQNSRTFPTFEILPRKPNTYPKPKRIPEATNKLVPRSHPSNKGTIRSACRESSRGFQ